MLVYQPCCRLQVSMAALDGEDAEMPPAPYIARTASLNGASAQPMAAPEGTASYPTPCADNEWPAILTSFQWHLNLYDSNILIPYMGLQATWPASGAWGRAVLWRAITAHGAFATTATSRGIAMASSTGPRFSRSPTSIALSARARSRPPTRVVSAVLPQIVIMFRGIATNRLRVV